MNMPVRLTLLTLGTFRTGALLSLVALAAFATVSSAAATTNHILGQFRNATASPWPLVPLHAVLNHNGTLLTYGSNAAGKQTGLFIYDVWDWRDGLAGPHYTLQNRTEVDSFCSGQIIDPNSGNVVLLGGDIWDGSKVLHKGNKNQLIFDPATNELTRHPGDMWRPRWYATATTLPDGRIYVQGGLGGKDYPELRHADGTFTLLTSVPTSGYSYYYPRNYVDTRGRVFGYTDLKMYSIDFAVSPPRLTALASLASAGPSGISSSEAMYEPGKILRMGGGAMNTSSTVAGKNTWAVIDIRGTKPVVQQSSSANRMPVGLHWHNATVIADGRVVVTGGSRQSNKLSGVNYRALIWTPTPNTRTGTWTTGAATTSNKARLYHSTAVLLPDASVLVAGGGAGGPQNNLNAEIYDPPYLFDESGELAPRPRIVDAPSIVQIGSSFDVGIESAEPVARVTLVKTGSVTHSFNMDQRFMRLSFTQSGTKLTVKAPTSRNVATPGRYLLFVLDAKGVPSIAKIVAVPVAS